MFVVDCRSRLVSVLVYVVVANSRMDSVLPTSLRMIIVFGPVSRRYTVPSSVAVQCRV